MKKRYGLLTVIAVFFSMVTFASMKANAADVHSSEEKAQQQVTFDFNAPNYNKTIAPGRDFYVLGTINGTLPDDALLTVSLYRNSDSQLVRQVHTNKKADKDNLYYNYPEITLFGTDDINLVKDSEMPDLVYDAQDPDTFKDQWRKCYYDENNFTATFNGGRYTYDVNPNDENGEPYETLTEGDYTVIVEAKSSDGVSLGSSQLAITLGNSPDKIMSRFSPNDHYQNILDVAAQTDYTLYIDDFSGLFYSVPFLVNYPQEMQIWMNRKWQLMDAIEYETGKTHFYIYNVSPTSTTWKVELATIQHLQKVNDPNSLECYYYDIGDLNVAGTKGKFVEFGENDNLQLNRVDYGTDTSQDNAVTENDLATVETDTDLSDGVDASVGETISIYGVVKPIQVGSDDLIYNESQSEYTINNRINTIEYTITGDGVDYTYSKEIGLNRTFEDGTTTLSLLEFKNDLEIPDAWAGKNLTISMQGFDSHGSAVDGTTETFTIDVETAAKKAA